MISVFRKEEILCWVDMNYSGYVPSLYLFRIENNKVAMHMEILQKGSYMYLVSSSGVSMINYGINAKYMYWGI